MTRSGMTGPWRPSVPGGHVGVAPAGKREDGGFVDILQHRIAAAHIAVERGVADRHLGFVAGGQQHMAELVGQRHQDQPARARLDILLGDIGARARESRRQRRPKASIAPEIGIVAYAMPSSWRTRPRPPGYVRWYRGSAASRRARAPAPAHRQRRRRKSRCRSRRRAPGPRRENRFCSRSRAAPASWRRKSVQPVRLGGEASAACRPARPRCASSVSASPPPRRPASARPGCGPHSARRTRRRTQSRPGRRTCAAKIRAARFPPRAPPPA
jgi:hypothetical protein